MTDIISVENKVYIVSPVNVLSERRFYLENVQLKYMTYTFKKEEIIERLELNYFKTTVIAVAV